MMSKLVKYYRTVIFLMATIAVELALIIARGGHL